jgi:hypothetical protein
MSKGPLRGLLHLLHGQAGVTYSATLGLSPFCVALQCFP